MMHARAGLAMTRCLVSAICLIAVLCRLPVQAMARQATPAGQSTTANTVDSPLAQMLAMVPAEALSLDGQILTYADVAGQLAAVGLNPANSLDDPAVSSFIRATNQLVWPGKINLSVNTSEWRAVFGFDAFQIDQTLEIGQPPRITTILRGRFDAAELRRAWETAGYRLVPDAPDGVVIASLHDGPEIDLDSAVARLALASMNHVALLPDGTLIYAAYLDDIERVLAVIEGGVASFASLNQVQSLMSAAGPDLASAILTGGATLRIDPMAIVGRGGDPPAAAIATRLAEPNPMPPVLLALLGVSQGGPVPPPLGNDATPEPMAPDAPHARFRLALLLENAEAARRAAPIIEQRLEEGESLATGQPYADFFPAADRRVEVVPNTPVVRLDLGFAKDRPPGVWLQLFYQRDLGFVAW